MRSTFTALAAFAIAALIAIALVGRASAPAQTDAAAQVEHGKYLVTQVAMCMDCHGENLNGGPLMFQPSGPMPKGMTWASRAPSLIEIARRATPEQFTSFLMGGVGPDGRHPNPPMPTYRLNAEDAAAVVAYIRSVAAMPAPAASSVPAPAGSPSMRPKP